jgi:hypothetical protein
VNGRPAPMPRPGPGIRTEADRRWDVSRDAEDGTVAVTVGMRYWFRADDLIDGSDAFVTAFWNEYVFRVDDELGRRRVLRSAGDGLQHRLEEVLEPARLILERALEARFRAMVDELGAAHEKLTHGGAR